MILFINTPSNQPHLLGRPVVAPTSPPIFAIRSPKSSKISVGIGPSPTLVTYALTTPNIFSTSKGPQPAPEAMPAGEQLLDVTYG